MELFRTIFRDMRGNVLWDATKWAVFNLGLPVLLTLWGALKALPVPVLVMLFIGSLAFVMFLFNQVIAFGDRRRSCVAARGAPDVQTKTESETGKSPVLRFGMPEDQARESHLVWFHLPVNVESGNPLERCEILLVDGAVPKPGALGLPLRWQTRDGTQAEITLDPGKGWYYIPLVRRNERDELGYAFFCDDQSYRNHGIWPGNMPPPGHKASYHILLRWSGGYCTSYPFEIHIPHKGVSNGKFCVRPLLDRESRMSQRES